MNYADGKGVQFVVIVGSDEMKTDKIKVKEMTTGEQSEITVEELINRVKG